MWNFDIVLRFNENVHREFKYKQLYDKYLI